MDRREELYLTGRGIAFLHPRKKAAKTGPFSNRGDSGNLVHSPGDKSPCCYNKPAEAGSINNHILPGFSMVDGPWPAFPHRPWTIDHPPCHPEGAWSSRPKDLFLCHESSTIKRVMDRVSRISQD
jgi:hypothetical protein